MDNPYSPPLQRIQPPVDTTQKTLATRGQRLAAAMIDGAINLAFIWSAMFLFLAINPFNPDRSLRLRETLWIGLFSMGVFLALHGYFLYRRSQSIGKMLLGIRIDDISGGRAGFGTILAKRLLPFWLIGSIPVIGGFAAAGETLFIFRADRRCIHDLIAGTEVVRIG